MSTYHTEESQRWATCLQIIRNNVSQQQYSIWFAPVAFDSFDAERNELTVCVPSPYFREHIETNYLSLLRQVLVRVYGRGIQLIYKVKVDAENGITVSESSTDSSTAVHQTLSSQPANAAPEPLQQLDSNLNADYTFDNFVEGAANKLPRTVGLSIAQNPHQMTFNPLFVYGASGVGKTHLVNAIGTRLKELHPARRVLYVSAHLFQVQYTDAVRQNRVNDFIAFYQSIDVLIIDDVQEFATLEKTQLAFFHIFNHLHQNGRQLILTSDRPPVALSGMNERLLTRFKWGLLAELEKPDMELRRDILLSKIRHDGLRIAPEVVDFIATHVDKSVRDLHGVLNSLMAFSIVHDCDIDVATARSVIERTIGLSEQPVTIEGIIEHTCAVMGLERADILSKSRKAGVVLGRQVAMYLAQKHTPLSTTRIGDAIGQRNHATVIHSCQIVSDRLQTDSELRKRVQEVEQMLK